MCGGAPYRDQEQGLRSGCDIIVGTPGRVKDHLDRKNLKFDNLKFRVLDEADEMLNMGFVDDVETILKVSGDIQTLLFSATLPPWVKDIAKAVLEERLRRSIWSATRNKRRAAKCNICCCHVSGKNECR